MHTVLTIAPTNRCKGKVTMCWLALCGIAAAHEAFAAEAQATPEGISSDIVAQALAYEHGEGVPKDQLQAAALYCEAARRGDAEAQFLLGWMYANGRGVSRDDGAAASLFALAASSGHVYAKKTLQFLGDERDRLPECMQAPAQPPSVTARSSDEEMLRNLPPRKQKIAELIFALAPTYNIDPRLAFAVVSIESNFEPTARSPKEARGLMQLIPGTAARFNVKKPFDIAENLRGGLTYLRWLLAYYKGKVALAVAAYNAGEKAVDRYRGVPPYRETRSYVYKVLELFGGDDHPYDASLTEPSPFLATGAGKM